MKKLLLLISIAILAGCALAPQERANIDTCSREANAYTVSSRIGNSAYWSCFDRVQAKQKELAQQQKINALRSRCISFGFKAGTNELAQCVVQQQQQEVQAQQQQIINEQKQKQSNWW